MLTQLVAVGATGGGHAPATPDELLDDELELDVELPDELLDEELVEEAPLDEELLLDELLELELLGATSLEVEPPPQAVSSAAASIGATRTKARPQDAASMDFQSFDMATLAA